MATVLRLLSGNHPRECTGGIAASFEKARVSFEAVIFLAKRTERDFQEYWCYQAHEAWKHAMWESALKLPT